MADKKTKCFIQIITPMMGYQNGDVVPVSIDENGRIKDDFWRRRVADAKNDGCVKVLKNPPKKRKAD